MSKVHRNPSLPEVEVPNLDLLTFLFDSDHCLAQDDTVLHISAEHPTQNITKRQLLDYTQRIAYSLRTYFGVGSTGVGNDVVTVVSHGQPLAPAAFFGVVAAGGVYSGVHSTATSHELSRQLKASGSKLLICSRETLGVVLEATQESNIPDQNIAVLESFPDWLLSTLDGHNLLGTNRLPWDNIIDRRILEQSVIVIIWSSGTTGLPKGVKLSHRNFVAQTYITHLLGRQKADVDVAKGCYAPYPPRMLAHLPASHISGMFGYFISNFYAGGLTVWMSRYQWDTFLQLMKNYEITQLFTVPSIWRRIARSPDVTDQFHTLRVAQSGSAPFDSVSQKAASTRLGDGGTALVAPSWGLSETTGGVTASQSDEMDEIGTLGSILPGLEVRLVDESLKDVDEGEAGELLVRGPTVMQGYFDNEAATRDAFHEGWLRTGDIATMNKGKIFMVDRKKELLKYKAQQIAPAELEALLCSHPDIDDAAVVGVAAKEEPGSDLPRAYVVSSSSRLSANVVQDYVGARAASYKQLRGGVMFVDEIPRNPSGKILRKDLTARAKREMMCFQAKL